jgi:hypothetical protein
MTLGKAAEAEARQAGAACVVGESVTPSGDRVGKEKMELPGQGKGQLGSVCVHRGCIGWYHHCTIVCSEYVHKLYMYACATFQYLSWYVVSCSSKLFMISVCGPGTVF